MTLPPDLQEKVNAVEAAIARREPANEREGTWRWSEPNTRQIEAGRAALAALVERLEAQQAALLMGEVFERRYQRALDEWPPTKAQWEHLESVQSAFLDAYSAALHPEEQERWRSGLWRQRS